MSIAKIETGHYYSTIVEQEKVVKNQPPGGLPIRNDDTPRYSIFLDFSTSMRQSMMENCYSYNIVNQTRSETMINFLDQLLSKLPDDRLMSIYGFSHELFHLWNGQFTSKNIPDIMSRVYKCNPEGMTYTGLVLNEVERINILTQRHFVILLSDGLTKIDQQDAELPQREKERLGYHSVDQILNATISPNVVYFTVGFGRDADPKVLGHLAQQSGGLFVYINDQTVNRSSTHLLGQRMARLEERGERLEIVLKHKQERLIVRRLENVLPFSKNELLSITMNETPISMNETNVADTELVQLAGLYRRLTHHHSIDSESFSDESLKHIAKEVEYGMNNRSQWLAPYVESVKSHLLHGLKILSIKEMGNEQANQYVLVEKKEVDRTQRTFDQSGIGRIYCTPSYKKDAGCFGQGTLVLTIRNNEHVFVPIDTLRPGDRVVTPNQRTSLITHIVQSKCWLINFEGVMISPYHPVQIQTENTYQWKFPIDLTVDDSRPFFGNCYNLMLENGEGREHAVFVRQFKNWIVAITLGHENRPIINRRLSVDDEAVVNHQFFSFKVREKLTALCSTGIVFPYGIQRSSKHHGVTEVFYQTE